MPSWLALVVTEPTLVRLPAALTLRALTWPAPPSWTHRNDPPREAARSIGAWLTGGAGHTPSACTPKRQGTRRYPLTLPLPALAT